MARYRTTFRRAEPMAVWRALCVACSCACALPAAAQDAATVTIEASRCTGLSAPEARLACYDALVGEALGDAVQRDRADIGRAPPSAAAEPVRPTAARPAPTRTPQRSGAKSDTDSDREPAVVELRTTRQTDERFGLSSSLDKRENEAAELTATIAAVRERLPNEYEITLENGQVWRQTSPKRYRLRPGQRVRIYQGSWGSAYRLAVEELGSFILVERHR